MLHIHVQDSPLDVDITHGFSGHDRNLVQNHITCVVDDHSQYILVWLAGRDVDWRREGTLCWEDVHPHVQSALRERESNNDSVVG